MSSIYLRFTDYKLGVLTSAGTFDNSTQPLPDTLDTKSNQLLKVASFACDIEQTLNIGSQSTGAGAGKVSFNPFTIKKTADAISTVLFQNCASGTPFKTVDAFILNNGGLTTMRYTFKLVAVKTISWSANGDDSNAEETVQFEYGGLFISLAPLGPDGKPGKLLQTGWNRVRNVRDADINAVIQ